MKHIQMVLSFLVAIVVVGISLLQPSAVLAQSQADSYPSRPVTIVSPNAPGGSLERDGRYWGQKLSESLGKPFVLDFKAGAGGLIGTNYAAKATPDGYTLLVISGSFTVSAVMHKALPYDPIKDFSPVSQLISRPAVLVVSAPLPIHTYSDYVNYARANPGKLNFGTSGIGGIHHLTGAWLHSLSNTKVTFIHYKGTGPQTADLLAGRGHVGISSVTLAKVHLKTGKTRAIAVMSAERTSHFPGMQTIAEQGLPEFEYSTWTGFLAPAAVPPAIVAKLGAELGRHAKDPAVIKQLATDGSVPVGSSPAEFRKTVATEINRWRKIAKELNVSAQN